MRDWDFKSVFGLWNRTRERTDQSQDRIFISLKDALYLGDTPFYCTCLNLFKFYHIFISHVIKTKNRNRSINKFKNLGYDRLQNKQPRQESGLCFF